MKTKKNKKVAPFKQGPRYKKPTKTYDEGQNVEKQFVPLARPISNDPPELLAPAGSKASWAAAVEAGADAVYLGLNDFSARSYADNFSLAELKAVIEESHKEGVKVYLAVNSLIKESEMEKAYKLMATAAEFSPDAFILQDLGLSLLAKKYFPQIELHASTLMAAHSLPALVTLRDAGFKRAVLARELAIDEVEALSKHSPIDVEIFIHGALCFCFSGLCLMSSFLGGRSALRGGCTQPCRRNYSRGGQKGAFFSTTDLAAAPYMNQLRQMPISCFKIEGRMKGPDYVHRVVSAYRMLLDAPEQDWPYALADAENILAEAPGRRQTGGPLAAASIGALAPLSATTSGLRVGFMEATHTGHAKIKVDRNIEIGDRVRLQPRVGDESPAFNIKEIILDGEKVDAAQIGDTVEIVSSKMPDFSGFLFKISSGREEKSFLASPLVKAVKVKAADTKLPAPKALPKEKPTTQKPKVMDMRKAPLWVWLEKAEDIKEVQSLEAKKIILPLTVPNVRHIKHQRRNIKSLLPNLIWSLPPLIFHRKQAVLGKELAGLMESSFRDFMISNLSQINMIKRAAKDISGVKIWGDHRLGYLNHWTEEALAAVGLHGGTISLEADEDTFKRLWKAPASMDRLIYFYGNPALFTARYPLDQRKIPIVSPKGEKFRLGLDGEETIVTSDKALFMAPLLKMPPLPNGKALIVDLRKVANLRDKCRELKKAFSGAGPGYGTAFNFKRGLI